MKPSKKDWKLFRMKISDWQESYMEKLVVEYIDFLKCDKPASTKFWELEKRIKQDKKKPGVILELRKNYMLFDIIDLINVGVITVDDLSDFSHELKDEIKFLQERMNHKA